MVDWSAREWRDAQLLHLRGYDPYASAGDDYAFDVDTANAACRFFSCLTFIEGEKAGQPFLLEDWQRAIVGALFGWRSADGLRRYREAMIYIPRKNGKTPLCAGIVLYGLFVDGEPGAQIYSAAAEREQAALVYRHAAGMIARDAFLSSQCRVYRTTKAIEIPASNTIYKALSSDAETKHGFSTHMVVVDELHAHKSGDLVDVLQTSMGARREPLMIHITTADYERESICNRKYDYACKVRDGVFDDKSFLPVVYEASDSDDWTDESVWAKANPNLDVSINRAFLRRECERAQREPTYENTFKRLHLNIRTRQDVRWIDMEAWDECNGEFDESQLEGMTCYMGLDLSTRIDITCECLLFPPARDELWRVLLRAWVPAESIEKRERIDHVPYATWAREGWIIPTPGNVVDYDKIKDQIRADAARFDVREIAYDPWNATQIALQLQGEGANVVQFGQGFRSMSEPAKELERMLAAKLFLFGGNPLLYWMAGNAAAEQDAAGNIKPSKKRSTERIDGIVALTMCIGRAMLKPESESVYDTRGVITL